MRDGHPAHSHIDPLVLRQAIDRKDETVASLRLGGQAWIKLADIVERAFAPDDDKSFSDEAASDKATPDPVS